MYRKKNLKGCAVLYSMSKLVGVEHNVALHHGDLRLLGAKIMSKIGCSSDVAREIADHLVDADLSGIHSHGSMRLSQYVHQYRKNLWTPSAQPRFFQSDTGAWIIDGQDCHGITAVRVGVRHCVDQALKQEGAGIACVGVRNCGHTGRIGVFAEEGAKRNCLTFVIGGGSRKSWRQVAPHGGAKGMLPTNPYAISIPGDARGAVTIDFATGATAGGWVMAAKKSKATLPAGLILDAEGRPTTDPNGYHNGGCILPAAGSKGYGLGLMAELIAYTMLGNVEKEAGLGLNTMVIALDTSRFRSKSTLMAASKEILEEMRRCPPAKGFERVEVPGQRENEKVERVMAEDGGRMQLPRGIWDDIVGTSTTLGIKGTMPRVEFLETCSRKRKIEACKDQLSAVVLKRLKTEGVDLDALFEEYSREKKSKM